ncbi:hypothetical protein FF2_046100 [Malus domestica]
MNLLFGFPQVLMTVKRKKNSSSSELDNSYSSALHQLVMLLHQSSSEPLRRHFLSGAVNPAHGLLSSSPTFRFKGSS